MKTGKIFATILLSTLLCASCFKQDEPYTLPPPGDAQVFTISQGETYHRQEYFSLSTLDTMGSEHTAWDMAFEAASDGWHVWINGSDQAFIANTFNTDFTAITDTLGADWKYDAASWSPDSTAVGDYRPDRYVYILDRGTAYTTDRFKKIIFQEENSLYYEIQYANLDGSNEVIKDIYKNDSYAYLYYTFESAGQVQNIEPPKANWDLLFTRYRYIFYDQFPPLPYLVTGVLINPSVEVAVDSLTNFSAITYATSQTMSYTAARDIIGFRWKQYDFTAQAYTVKSYINYVIKDMDGVYWKLHFLDFYNSQGEKGYPMFEFQRL